MIQKVLALALLWGGFVWNASAATSATLPTNLIQNISLQLSLVAPGQTSSTGQTVSNLTVNTKYAIQALGATLKKTFSANAQLVSVVPLYPYTVSIVTTNKGKAVTNNYTYLYTGNNASIQIRDGATMVDVTSFVTISSLNTSYIASSSMNRQGNYTAFKQYRVRSISVNAPPYSFSGQGFVESPLVSIPVGSAIVWGYDDNWTSFTGVASNASGEAVLQGTISATYEKLE